MGKPHRATAVHPQVATADVIGGGFHQSSGNAFYARHISHLPPQAAPGALDTQALVQLTNTEAARMGGAYAKKGPYVYHNVLPDMRASTDSIGSLRSSKGSSKGSPRPWGAGQGLQRRPASPRAQQVFDMRASASVRAEVLTAQQVAALQQTQAATNAAAHTAIPMRADTVPVAAQQAAAAVPQPAAAQPSSSPASAPAEQSSPAAVPAVQEAAQPQAAHAPQQPASQHIQQQVLQAAPAAPAAPAVVNVTQQQNAHAPVPAAVAKPHAADFTFQSTHSTVSEPQSASMTWPRAAAETAASSSGAASTAHIGSTATSHAGQQHGVAPQSLGTAAHVADSPHVPNMAHQSAAAAVPAYSGAGGAVPAAPKLQPPASESSSVWSQAASSPRRHSRAGRDRGPVMHALPSSVLRSQHGHTHSVYSSAASVQGYHPAIYSPHELQGLVAYQPGTVSTQALDRTTLRRMHAHRDGLQRDIALQQLATDVLTTENNRLARQAHATEQALNSGAIVSPDGAYLVANMSASRSQWSAAHTHALSDATLSQRVYRVGEDAGTETSAPGSTADASQMGSLLRLLQAVKEPPQPQMQLGGAAAAAAGVAAGEAAAAAGTQVSEVLDVYSVPIEEKHWLHAMEDSVPWTAVELLRAELAGEIARRQPLQQPAGAGTTAAVSAAAGNAAVAATDASSATKTSNTAGQQAGTQPSSTVNATSSTNSTAASSTVSQKDAATPAAASTQPVAKGPAASKAEDSPSSSGASTPRQTTAGAAHHGTGRSTAAPPTAAAGTATATATATAAAAPTQPVDINTLTVPYSALLDVERFDRALEQLLKPPRGGAVAGVYTRAHRPLPQFEDTCERTKLRMMWGSAAKGEQRSKLLRDAEDVMAERQAEEAALEEALEAGAEGCMTESEVLAAFDQEQKDEDAAIKRAAQRAARDRADAEAETAAANAPRTGAQRRAEDARLSREFRSGAAQGTDSPDANDNNSDQDDDGEATLSTPSSTHKSAVTHTTTITTTHSATGTTASSAHCKDTATGQQGVGSEKAGAQTGAATGAAASEQRLPSDMVREKIQVNETDVYGTYGGVRSVQSPWDGTSATYRSLAYGRTVRDRLLLIEHACKDLQLRGLADVAPESWTAADKTLCEREEILDKVIEDDLTERAAAAEAEAEQQKTEALEAQALQRARAQAAAEAKQLNEDLEDTKPTKPTTPTNKQQGTTAAAKGAASSQADVDGAESDDGASVAKPTKPSRPQAIATAANGASSSKDNADGAESDDEAQRPESGHKSKDKAPQTPQKDHVGAAVAAPTHENKAAHSVKGKDSDDDE